MRKLSYELWSLSEYSEIEIKHVEVDLNEKSSCSYQFSLPKALVFRCCTIVSLKHFSHIWKNVTEVLFDDCEFKLTDSLDLGLENIKVLTLEAREDLFPSIKEGFLSKLPLLKKLTITHLDSHNWYPFLTAPSLESLSLIFKQKESLLTDIGNEETLKTLPLESLKRLSFNKGAMGHLTDLTVFKSLPELEFKNCNMPFIRTITDLPNLTHLTLDGCKTLKLTSINIPTMTSFSIEVLSDSEDISLEVDVKRLHYFSLILKDGTKCKSLLNTFYCIVLSRFFTGRYFFRDSHFPKDNIGELLSRTLGKDSYSIFSRDDHSHALVTIERKAS